MDMKVELILALRSNQVPYNGKEARGTAARPHGPRATEEKPDHGQESTEHTEVLHLIGWGTLGEKVHLSPAQLGNQRLL